MEGREESVGEGGMEWGRVVEVEGRKEKKGKTMTEEKW